MRVVGAVEPLAHAVVLALQGQCPPSLVQPDVPGRPNCRLRLAQTRASVEAAQ